MKDPDNGDRILVEDGAVIKLSNKEAWSLMHPTKK